MWAVRMKTNHRLLADITIRVVISTSIANTTEEKVVVSKTLVEMMTRITLTSANTAESITKRSPRNIIDAMILTHLINVVAPDLDLQTARHTKLDLQVILFRTRPFKIIQPKMVEKLQPIMAAREISMLQTENKTTIAGCSLRQIGIKPQLIATSFTFQTRRLVRESEKTSGQMQTNKTWLDNVSAIILIFIQIQCLISLSPSLPVMTDKVENLDNSNPALLVGQNPELIQNLNPTVLNAL